VGSGKDRSGKQRFGFAGFSSDWFGWAGTARQGTLWLGPVWFGWAGVAGVERKSRDGIGKDRNRIAGKERWGMKR
jgi:hypothetical protein